MPRLLAAKQYPGLVDVYTEVVEEDPFTGELLRYWDYENPATYGCNFLSLRGHVEKFGEVYSDKDAVKLEVRPEDGAFINLAQRFGNLRMRLNETQDYFEWVGQRSSSARYAFNIDGMNPQVDNLGRIVCVEVFGTLTTVFQK